MGVVAASLALIPAVIAAWLLLDRPAVPTEAWIIGVVSGLVEVAYFVFLASAYRRGDLSVVYPLARGSAPLLAVIVAVTVLGERLPAAAWAGVALLFAGLMVVQRPWSLLRTASARDRSGVAFALLTGAMIAVYSSLDTVGVGLTPAWLYAGILWPVCGAGLLVVAWLRSRIAGGRLTPPSEPAEHGSRRRGRVHHVHRLRVRPGGAVPGAAGDRRAPPGVRGAADLRVGRAPAEGGRRAGGRSGSGWPAPCWCWRGRSCWPSPADATIGPSTRRSTMPSLTLGYKASAEQFPPAAASSTSPSPRRHAGFDSRLDQRPLPAVAPHGRPRPERARLAGRRRRRPPVASSSAPPSSPRPSATTRRSSRRRSAPSAASRRGA